MNNKFTVMFLTAYILTAQAEGPPIQTNLPKVTCHTPTPEEIESNRRQTEFSYRNSKNMRLQDMYATLNLILSTAQQDARFVQPEILNNARFDLAIMHQNGLGITRDYEKAQILFEDILDDSNTSADIKNRAREQLRIMGVYLY